MSETLPPASAPARGGSNALLTVEDVAVVYSRAARAVDGLSFSIGKGEIVALLGPNGAGKTTALRAIAGFLPGDRAVVERGSITFEGSDIRKVPSHRITSMGIAMVAERDKIFPSLSVADNLKLGSLANRDSSQSERLRTLVDRMFPILSERRDQIAGYLSGGERQMLSIAAALLCNPRILLVDELSLGLAPKVVGELIESLRRLNREEGMTILLVEQSATVAFALANYVYILGHGHITTEGAPDELKRLADFRSVYLGVGGKKQDARLGTANS
ncbi:MAG: ABC transporter ATP-binding protein [Mesorhizobium sp.]|nr:ABC transporter ATP-binding protein [Mesorhizobium sp.]MCO5164095.1 ABC transporter ATP-binding protein [Mesorhizobium sp.]